jgi:acyl carrier protein
MNEPPTRDEVLALVKRYLFEVIEGLSEDRFDTQQSMAESGANSLEIMEVVSFAMRDLGVRIPRAELALMANIDEVVDALHQASLAKARAEQ